MTQAKNIKTQCLSILIITKNSEVTIEKTVQSAIQYSQNIVVVDSCSTDKTTEIINKYIKTNKHIQLIRKEFTDIGKQRIYGLKYCVNDWVFILDSDEEITDKLHKEIISKIQSTKYHGYNIPFQSFYINRPLYFGGENYYQLRLINQKFVKILSSIVHNQFDIDIKRIGTVNNKLNHYSYRSLSQIYRKFTDYGILMAKQKSEDKETSSLKKIFLYPVHMLYARFIKDKGYKDGLFRLPLDIGFGYMEFIMYITLLVLNIKKITKNYENE